MLAYDQIDPAGDISKLLAALCSLKANSMRGPNTDAFEAEQFRDITRDEKPQVEQSPAETKRLFQMATINVKRV